MFFGSTAHEEDFTVLGSCVKKALDLMRLLMTVLVSGASFSRKYLPFIGLAAGEAVRLFYSQWRYVVSLQWLASMQLVWGHSAP